MRAWWLTLLVVLGAPTLASGAAAPAPDAARARFVFRYRDDQGTVCLTDRFRAIPERYRSRAEKIPLPPRPPPAPPRSAVVAPPAPASPQPRPAIVPLVDAPRAPAQAEQPATPPAGRNKHVTALALVLLAPLLYQGVCVLCRSLGSRQLSSVIRFSFLVSVPLLLVCLYSQQLVRAYFRLKDDIVAFQRRRSEQGEQSIRALGELDRDR